MINHHMILEGIKYGLIQFKVDPNLEHGTVCAIGDNWFYFGGETAEEMNPEDYLRETPLGDLIDEIISALDGLRTPPDEALYDEYAYYEAVLTEALGGKTALHHPRGSDCPARCSCSRFGKADDRTAGKLLLHR